MVVALGGSERDKINYLNGFVRGGLLNLREKRRLPIRLAVTYGAVEGPATTFTKDINEEGVFLFTDKPLPETSQVHMLVTIPGKPQPLSLVGKVSHTILDAGRRAARHGHRVRARRRDRARSCRGRDQGARGAAGRRQRAADPHDRVESQLAAELRTSPGGWHRETWHVARAPLRSRR